MDKIIPTSEISVSQITQSVQELDTATRRLQAVIDANHSMGMLHLLVNLGGALHAAVARLWNAKFGLRFLSPDVEKQMIWTEEIISAVRRFAQGLEDETVYFITALRLPFVDHLQGVVVKPEGAFAQLDKLSEAFRSQHYDSEYKGRSPIGFGGASPPALIYLCDLATEVDVVAGELEMTKQVLGEVCHIMWGDFVAQVEVQDDV
ncbi:hypothetical protein H2198_005152 [Neophaeococcomyces mojaviensis]|uniref:Uncharacterized protein n=1 Tax=Neophaeococcomyces mojaviensis TaxID=3383035 RepID=A0ACC3A6X6_9EURO|nr:hypothetical protein H2198_005152 [Knufia sp. JES_112]